MIKMNKIRIVKKLKIKYSKIYKMKQFNKINK